MHGARMKKSNQSLIPLRHNRSAKIVTIAFSPVTIPKRLIILPPMTSAMDGRYIGRRCVTYQNNRVSQMK